MSLVRRVLMLPNVLRVKPSTFARCFFFLLTRRPPRSTLFPYTPPFRSRRLPVAEPPERVEAGAHPLLRLRPRVRRPPGDADVLSRRSLVRPRSDLPVRSRPEDRIVVEIGRAHV